MTRSRLKRITDFLEYLFLLTVILECNSMFAHTAWTLSGMDMSAVLNRLGLGLAGGALAPIWVLSQAPHWPADLQHLGTGLALALATLAGALLSRRYLPGGRVLVEPEDDKDAADWQAALASSMADQPLRAAVDEVAKKFGLKRKEVYDAALAIKAEK